MNYVNNLNRYVNSSLGTQKCGAEDYKVIAILTALFVVLNADFVYEQTNRLWNLIPGTKNNVLVVGGKPTKWGLALHAAVFAAILYFWVLCK
jgi:hypothetical protein